MALSPGQVPRPCPRDDQAPERRCGSVRATCRSWCCPYTMSGRQSRGRSSCLGSLGQPRCVTGEAGRDRTQEPNPPVLALCGHCGPSRLQCPCRIRGVHMSKWRESPSCINLPRGNSASEHVVSWRGREGESQPPTPARPQGTCSRASPS